MCGKQHEAVASIQLLKLLKVLHVSLYAIFVHRETN